MINSVFANIFPFQNVYCDKQNKQKDKETMPMPMPSLSRKHLHNAISNNRIINIPIQSSQLNKSNIGSDIFVTKYPGSRIIEFMSSKNGNVLKTNNMIKISNLIDTYQDSVAVAAVFFASQDNKVFSEGFGQSYSVNTLQHAHNLSLKIRSSNRVTLAVYNGKLKASPFGVFATSKFRLGHSDTTFTISELQEKNNFPFGGFAYHITKGCPEGLTIARYLGLSGKGLGIDALLATGMITHLVEHDPQTTIADSLVMTRPNNLETKRWQGDLVDKDLIEDMLESMGPHIDVDIDENDPLLDNFLVPLQPLDDVESDSNLCDDDLISHSASIDYCLQEDSLLECEKRLKKFVPQDGSDNWATNAIHGLQSLDVTKLESWFKLTRFAHSSEKLDNVLEYEIQNYEVHASFAPTSNL